MMKKNRSGRDELCDMLADCNGYLKRVLAVRGADPDTQEEIAQEAIFQGYEKLHKLRDPAKLKPITYDPVNNTYIGLGNVVGKAFADGAKLK